MAQKLAGIEIKDSLVGSAAIAADQVSAGINAVAIDDVQKVVIAGLLSSVENDSNIHHDVDECAVLGKERPEKSRFFMKAKTHSFSGLNDDIIFVGVASSEKPGSPRVPEGKP